MDTSRHGISDTPRLLEVMQALAPHIRDAADTIEADRRLPPALVRALKEAEVFRMAMPHEYGGPELDPLTQVRVIEELSRLDGSVGWCAMIGVTSGYLCAFLKEPAARRLYADLDAVTAGQVAPMGRADLVAGGYRVSGRWGFASGCHHADVMLAGCTIFDHGEPRHLANGQPETRLMLLPVSACTILDTWYTTGLRGTGSQDFIVNDVFVPVEEAVSFFEPPHCAGALYTLPQMFLVNHSGVPLGIARSAIDAVLDLSAHKMELPTRQLLREEELVQEAVAQAEAALGAARSYVFSTLAELWETLCQGMALSPRQRALFRLAIVYVHRVAKDVVALMYDTAATSAIFQTHPLERHMRDILTACQHRVVQAKMYRPAGRLLLGLEPGNPFF
jgi:alkylation response protein AidB-like acyl-CoA dehydrogenase